ncbi:zinc finger CCHC domain-containing protein 3-like [Xenopus tropicalis]|uniref:Zinc finger CCHC domain-containing protein 3-like n=1 Tax=Xenopus tropicalis TaxID=8364 RepID=A0A803KC66_XENTR|nr:zinc finger CCHC domain-containing protein 3-like [Xenopus tropicalis]
MATEDGSVPAFVRVKNSIRVIAANPENLERGLAYVVQVILEDFGRVVKREILAIQDYPKRGVYDVTFGGEGVYRSFMGILQVFSNDPRLDGFKILPHFAEEERFLVIKSYSPFVPLKEIEAVLGRYCKKLAFVGKILNELGIWTLKYRFKAVFEKDTYPPARFRLGTVNIDCFFNGMPVFCKRCRQYGHAMEGCTLCQNCGKDGHDGKSCPIAKKCNFCLQGGHLYGGCPQRKVEKAAGDPVMPSTSVDLVSPLSDGEVSIEKDSKGQLVVKRIKTVKGKKKPEVSPVFVESSETVVVESRSRGEKLYKFYKGKNTAEIKDAVEGWSDSDEYEAMDKIISGTQENKDIRKAVLSYIRGLM